MTLTQTTTWYLEMDTPAKLRPGRDPDLPATVARVEHACPEYSRFFYRSVGGNWYWIDRIAWTYEEWQHWVERVETWAAYVGGTPAGYFELQRRPVSDSVNLALFGLLPWAIGRGLGGWLLTKAIERAWEIGPRSVTVNTCSLDGPHALANYQARGFAIVKIYTSACDLPDQSPGPWQGARGEG